MLKLSKQQAGAFVAESEIAKNTASGYTSRCTITRCASRAAKFHHESSARLLGFRAFWHFKFLLAAGKNR